MAMIFDVTSGRQMRSVRSLDRRSVQQSDFLLSRVPRHICQVQVEAVGDIAAPAARDLKPGSEGGFKKECLS